ncbi:hypothetical protein Phum_PHUM311930 [Pediculus humanus corporis]|uniref:Uncharacterized protein n=1 Tax=Pediculus humanus subsp. corporis TaxID=121224 RepID=E0VML1_PEDHC|nr:uncharacterized protein Phum_PHUM311930 [Pediculus humanus corporis]EEB14617.1 hypothetical protein Phum_PHUM311930 [Pediculus humanus corporis]
MTTRQRVFFFYCTTSRKYSSGSSVGSVLVFKGCRGRRRAVEERGNEGGSNREIREILNF